MGSLWTPSEDELFRRVDEVLYYVWDPVGVRHIPGARDEYRAWAPEVYMLLTAETTAQQLSACLDELAKVWLGAPACGGRCSDAADVLLAWKQRLLRPRRSRPSADAPAAPRHSATLPDAVVHGVRAPDGLMTPAIHSFESVPIST